MTCTDFMVKLLGGFATVMGGGFALLIVALVLVRVDGRWRFQMVRRVPRSKDEVEQMQ